MSTTSGERKKANVNAILKNELVHNEFREMKLHDFEPKDDRFFDALASMALRDRIIDGNLKSVKFYTNNGYDARIRMAQENSTQTLVEFTLNTAKVTKDPKIKNNLKKIANFLQNKIGYSMTETPIFKVIEINHNNHVGIQMHYRVENYNCIFKQMDGFLAIAENFDENGLASYEVQSKEEQKKSSKLLNANSRSQTNLSGLSTLAKNQIILKYQLSKEAASSEGILHMLASLQIWDAIADGDLSRLKFYIQNGYNSNLVCRIDGTQGTLHEVAEHFYTIAPNMEAKANFYNVRNYIYNMFHPNVLDNVILEVLAYKPGSREAIVTYASRIGKHKMLEQDKNIYFDESIPK